MPSYAIPKEVLDFAWKAPIGTHSVGDHRIVKDEKMFLVSSPYNYDNVSAKKNIGTGICIVAFPKKEHFELFKKARDSVEPSGPSDWNPGGIGTVKLRKITSDGRPLMLMNLVQAHYRAGEREDMLPWNVAKQYAGWRKRALHIALETARQYHVDLYVPLSRGGRNGKALDEDLHSVFKEAGVRASEVDTEWTGRDFRSALLVKLKK